MHPGNVLDIDNEVSLIEFGMMMISSEDGSTWSWEYLRKIQRLPEFIPSTYQTTHVKTWTDHIRNN